MTAVFSKSFGLDINILNVCQKLMKEDEHCYHLLNAISAPGTVLRVLTKTVTFISPYSPELQCFWSKVDIKVSE